MLFGIIASIAGLLLVSALFPDLPVGKAIRWFLVEAPAAWLNDATPRQMFILVLVILGALVLSIAAPELLPMVSDVALYIDILAATSLALASLRIKGLGQIVKAVVGRVARRIARSPAKARSRRVRFSRPKPPASNDDDPGEGWRIAA